MLGNFKLTLRRTKSHDEGEVGCKTPKEEKRRVQWCVKIGVEVGNWAYMEE